LMLEDLLGPVTRVTKKKRGGWARVPTWAPARKVSAVMGFRPKNNYFAEM